MATNALSQTEADALIAIPKLRVDDTIYTYPAAGGSISIDLTSEDRHESFVLDIGRGRLDLAKRKYQTRARQIVVLVRLDFGAPHRNPDDEEVGSPHLHLYREGYGDKWAIPVPPDRFKDLGNHWQVLDDFLRFSNVVKPPLIERGLFT